MNVRDRQKVAVDTLQEFLDALPRRWPQARLEHVSIGRSDAEVTISVAAAGRELLRETIQIGDYRKEPHDLVYLPTWRRSLGSLQEMWRYLDTELSSRLDGVTTTLEHLRKSSAQTSATPLISDAATGVEPRTARPTCRKKIEPAKRHASQPLRNVTFRLDGALVDIHFLVDFAGTVGQGGEEDHLVVRTHEALDLALADGSARTVISESELAEFLSRSREVRLSVLSDAPDCVVNAVLYRMFPSIRWTSVVTTKGQLVEPRFAGDSLLVTNRGADLEVAAEVGLTLLLQRATGEEASSDDERDADFVADQPARVLEILNELCRPSSKSAL